MTFLMYECLGMLIAALMIFSGQIFWDFKNANLDQKQRIILKVKQSIYFLPILALGFLWMI